MIGAGTLTLQRLLGLVEGHLRRILPGRPGVPGRAYAATRSGAVFVIEFPIPGWDGDAEATAAILTHEIARRGCRLFVLVQQDGSALIRLDGHRLGRRPAQAGRLLRLERAGRRIAGLHRVEGPRGNEARESWRALA